MIRLKNTLMLLMAMIISITSIQAPCVYAKELNTNLTLKEIPQHEYSNDNATFIQTIDLGDGLVCKIYEVATISPFASGTTTKTHDFSLYYSGTYFGYLRQTTSWTYDGTSRPTLNSSSNTFYSTDTSNHYLNGKGSATSNYGSTSKQYNRKADVYYNKSYIATTNFTTICDKNGNLSFACTDD